MKQETKQNCRAFNFSLVFFFLHTKHIIGCCWCGVSFISGIGAHSHFKWRETRSRNNTRNSTTQNLLLNQFSYSCSSLILTVNWFSCVSEDQIDKTKSSFSSQNEVKTKRKKKKGKKPKQNQIVPKSNCDMFPFRRIFHSLTQISQVWSRRNRTV